jgi:DNA-binding MarR family transcriptional regulator
MPLQHELKKKNPFASLRQEAILGVIRTSDRLQIRFARLLREFGLTSAQYNVLRILRGEGKPLPILEIADRLIAVVPGITGLIDRLEEAGLVERRRCDQDRRVIYVAPTAAAAKLLGQLDAPVGELEERLLARLPAADLRELIRLLDEIRRCLSEDR